MTGVLFPEPGIEETRPFRAGEPKKPFSDKADLLLKSMNRSISEMVSKRCGIMIGCQGLRIPKHNGLLLRHLCAGHLEFSCFSTVDASLLQIRQSPSPTPCYGPIGLAFLVLIRI
jgi:hypothetical protein